MPKTKTSLRGKTPIQILNVERVKLLKKHRSGTLTYTVEWLKVANPESPLHLEYDRQLRAARVTMNAIIKQIEEKK